MTTGKSKLALEVQERIKKQKLDRKTLKKGDWVTYGAMSDAHMGMIEEIDHPNNSCVIRGDEKQTDFHDCYWTLSPYVNKRYSFFEAAGTWYNYLRQGDYWGGGMSFDSFLFLIHQLWPSYSKDLTYEDIRSWIK